MRAVDRTTLRLSGAVDGVPFDITNPPAGGSWQVDWNVPPGQPIDLSLRWYDASGLTLATLDARLPPVNGNGPIEIDERDYSTAIHDDDADGYSNVEERRCDSNPFDSVSLPDDECVDVGTSGGEDDDGGIGPDPTMRPFDIVDVEIPRVSSTPSIDGLYEAAWDSAAFDGNAGELLVDTLMIDRAAGPLVARPGYKWGAMHDGESLYVYVEGKAVGAPLFGDSAQPWDDDNLNLFIDGDGSGGSSYDGVDDRHLFLPLIGPGGANTQDGRVQAGPSSAGVPAGLRFTTCLCTSGRHTWEIAIPLASLGIEIGRPFGIEVQIDEDNDGGGRDARFGWAHPSRQGEDVDFTYLNPSFMGRARLF